jgi:hypothetical protein
MSTSRKVWLACTLLAGCSSADTTTEPFRIGDSGDSGNSGMAIDAHEPMTASTEHAQRTQDAVVATSALPRLSHRQWAHAVQDLLRLDALPDVSKLPLDPTSGTIFDNATDRFEVAPNLWSDYQALSERIAAEVATDPSALAKLPRDEAALVDQLGARALRRPLDTDERAAYRELFQLATSVFPERDAFSAGAELLIAALLQAPAFLYQIEHANAAGEDGLAERSDYELAARLSFMLWDSAPDDELSKEAGAGRLHTPEQIEAQAKRMLDAPRASEKLLEFYRQWLGLRGYDAIQDDTLPEHFGEMLRASEEQFVKSTVLDTRGAYADLFRANYSFVNRPLAEYYGLSGDYGDYGDYGDEMVRAELDATQRSGFLTHLGFLVSTAGDTAPIHRGVFINRRLLCASLPPPPAFTPGEMSGDTRRERIDSITGKGTCGESCHAALINPTGFPFEYYDDRGRHRAEDNGHAVDGSARYAFADGEQSYDGAIEWSRALVASHQAHACYAQHLLEFSLGRPHHADDAALLARMAEASGAATPIRELILLLVRSKGFATRRTEAP